MNEDETRKLLLLRVQLYSAMQMLKGEALQEFWTLIAEISELREYSDSRRETVVTEELAT